MTPADASVEIESVDQSAKGFRRTLSVERTETGMRRYHLPVGDYRIRVTRQGYAPIARDVAIADASQTLRVGLERE